MAVLLQLAIVAWAVSDAGDLLHAPIRNDDSAGHFYSGLHAAAHWQRAGAIWGYDPYWLAGYPEGVLGLVDNKLFALVLALVPGSWAAAAYNATVLLVLLSPPWLLYLAARTRGAAVGAAGGAALAAMIATFTVPLTVGFLVWGGTSFFLAAVMVVPATVGLAARIHSGTLLRSRGALALALAAATLFVHPAVLPVMAAGLLPSVFAARHRRGWLLLDLALIGLVAAAAFFPMAEAYMDVRGQFRAHFAPGAMFLRDPGQGSMHGGLPQLVDDWWTTLFEIDRWPHGAGGMLALALLALFAAPPQRQDIPQRSIEPGVARQVVFCAAVAAAFLAYVASSLSARAALGQPHRFMLLLGFFLCLPAGEALAGLGAGTRSWRRSVVVVIALAIAVRAAVGLLPIFVLGTGWDPAEEALADLIEHDGDGGGRTLVESTFEPTMPASRGSERMIPLKRFALLPLRTGREMIGYYFTGAISAQRYASFREGGILGRVLSTLDDAAAEDLFRRFAVTRVVACAPRSVRALERLEAALERPESLGGCWAFRVRHPEPSRLIEGHGDVQAGLDRIEVRDAEGERLVFKYHWLPTLRTEPPLPIEEAPQAGSPVGFIAVRPGGTREFAIVQKRSRGRAELVGSALRTRLGL